MKTFEYIPVPTPKRSLFKLNNEYKTDMDMGQIIPFFSRLMLPGDTFRIGNEVLVRAQPMVAPIIHSIDVETRYFAVPWRILFGQDLLDDDGNIVDYEVDDNAFLKFLSGGKDGLDNSITLPRWQPTGNEIVNDLWNGIAAGEEGSNAEYPNVTTTDNGSYSLWDYFGYPTGIIPQGAFPLDFKRRAYNLIWNNYWRDQNVQDRVSITNSKVLNCCWKKDYFTSALPWAQRGPSYGIPVSGNIPVTISGQGQALLHTFAAVPVSDFQTTYFYKGSYLPGDSSSSKFGNVIKQGDNIYLNDASGSPINVTESANTFNPVGVSVSGLSGSGSASGLATFDVSQLRVAFQVQKWMERSALGGVSTINQFLLSHYGVAPKNETIQNPVYIGGSKSPVIISEVLQTSQTTQDDEDLDIQGSPQGNLAGHGISADKNYIATYHAKEFCVVLGLMVIRPRADYQQGIDREDLIRSRYDMYDPLYVSLSEQAVERAEIYATNDQNLDVKGDPVIFGYQGRFNEFRSAHNQITGGLRSTFNYWHVSRIFSDVPELNSDFVKCNPSKRIFSSYREPGFIVAVANKVDAYRPLPSMAIPGYIDHH